MKATFFLFIGILFCTFSFAQVSSCDDNEKQLAKLIEEANYIKANELFLASKEKCSKTSEQFIKTSIKLLQHNVDAAKTDVKQKNVNELLNYYDLYDKNFPKNENANQLNKAILIFNTNPSQSDDIFTLLNSEFEKNKFNFNKPTILYQYFYILTQKYNNKEISFDKLIQKYGEVSQVLEINKPKFQENYIEFDNAKIALKSLINANFKKQDIVQYTELNFDDQKENIGWLTSSADLLSEKNALLPIYGKIATQLYQLQATSKTAYHLANYYLQTKKQDEAIKLFEESALLSKDKLEKANIYFLLSKMYGANQKDKSKSLLQQAIANDENNGKYYVFLANLYTNSVSLCSSSNIERVAIYELAKQTLLIGAQKEPRLAPTTTKLIEQYKNNSPTNEDLQQIKKLNNKVKLGCWINETVVF